jgi:hypothetical protein
MMPSAAVPLAGNEMALQPVLIPDEREEVPDYTVAYAASFAVCALAVAGVAMRNPTMRSNRRTAAPVMSASESWDEDDDELLRREMEKMMGSQELIRGPADDVMRFRMMAYVVVFNRGTPNEGVYTLETMDGGSIRQLLTFENAEDASRYARLLQGEAFTVVGNERSVSLNAQPFMWDTRRIEQFCHGGDFEVALVPSGGTITPPETNMYDPARFGDGHFSPEGRFPSGNSMGSMFNKVSPRENVNRRRAHDILRKSNMSAHQKRGREVWDNAMRNANAAAEGRNNFGEEMCGIEECGLDKHLGERSSLEKLYGSGPWGNGPEGPGPEGPGGPGGPGDSRPWGPGPWGP